ncbi:LamG-like jellyroll fold domain-containing protein [Hymenobacter lucidus]|uniref:T9SS type A sorting domain-containing protein n=1 Tax=Hymenobacter lucidus TaxID=2880930 RepID=A0ABS8AT37_9BACT|nr:LamG-like jellyroll fold domain-containing protein [Hymenobacter lucidus]MCB2409370.1 hypothetical protein [Hymenobacter lucidus]
MQHPYPLAARAAHSRYVTVAAHLFLLLTLLLPWAARAQAPAWSAATIGSSTQLSGTSQTRATAVDASGNVFVTGNFTGQVAFGSTVLSSVGSGDLFVAKYVPATATWAWAQSGGGANADQGNGIAVSGGSVYVTGYIQNNTANASGVLFGGTGTTPGTVQVNGASGTNSADLVVAKYTDNGPTATLSWTQVGGGAGTDLASGIAVSGGSVYVTGYITNTTANANTVLFGGTGTTPGTVQVNGASATSSTDMVVAKYTDNGPTATLGWTQVGGGTSNDVGSGIAVSGTGSVYVTGYITNSTSNIRLVLFGGTGTTPGTVPQNGASGSATQDLVVAKYTDNGTTATLGWTQVGGGVNSDQSFGIAVSGTSVYVTGYITNNTANASAVFFGGTGTTPGTVPQNGATGTIGDDLVVAKYTDNGTTATLGWTQVGGGISNDRASGIAVSGTSVYVTGYITNNTGNSRFVLFGGMGTTPGTVPQNGASGSVAQDVVVAKYTDNGTTATLGWTQVGGSINDDQGLGIAVSGSSVHVAGYVAALGAATFGTAAGSPLLGTTGNRAVLATLTDNGSTGPWQVLAAATNGGTSQTRATAVDAAGNVFVTGNFSGTVAFGSTVLSAVGNNDLFVAKYVPATATWAWAQSGGGIDNDLGSGIAVSGGSVYVTGHITNTTANTNGVLFGGTGTTPGTVQVNGAAATSSQDLVVVKYTDNGTTATLGWIQVNGGTSNDQGLGIAVSGTGSVYVTGYITNTTANASGVLFGGTDTTPGTVQVNGASGTISSDLVVAKYTDNGATATLGWTQVGGGTNLDQGQGIAVSGGRVYVTGYITNNTANASGVLFGGAGTTPGTVQVNGASGTASTTLVVAKYTDNGPTATLGWTQVGGGTGDDRGLGIAVSGTGSVYVTGSIVNNTGNTNGVLFGGTGTTPGTVQVSGASGTASQDLVVAKYTDNGPTATLVWIQRGGGTSIDQGLGIAVSGGSVYVTGYITNTTANTNTVLFSGAVQVSGASGTSSPDLLVAKYTDNGAISTLDWTQVGGGTGDDRGLGIAVSGPRVYAAGYTVPSATFGSFTIATPVGGNTSFLGELRDGVVAPTITSFTPDRGPVGTRVTLTGTDLAGATSVSFNGTAQTTFISNSATEIVLRVPAGATTGTLTVTTPGGTSAASAQTFTVCALPVALAQNVSVTLDVNGNATVAATALNNGSTADCGLAAAGSLSVSPASFSCTDVTPASVTNALRFNGTNQYVAIGSTATVPVGNSAYTIEAWIKPTSMGNYGIIGWGNYGTTNQVNALRLTTTGLVNYWWGNDLDLPTANLAGAWHHVAATFDGTTRTLYVDGVAMGSNTPGAGHVVPNASNLRLGSTNLASAGNPTGTGEYFSGSIDEVRVWSVARTAAQLSAAKGAGLPGSTAGLMVYYRLNEGSGLTTADATGTAANVGTLTNGPTWTPTDAAPVTNGTPVTLTVTDAGGNTATASAVVTVSVPATPTTTWNGASSTVWTDCANWSFGKVPDAFTNAVIPAGLSRYPELTAGTFTVQDLTIADGASFTLGSAGLQVYGNWENNGTASLAGPVNFRGNTNQTLGGGSQTTFSTLTVDKTPSFTLTLQRATTVTGTLNMTTNGLLITGPYDLTTTGATLNERENSYVLGNVVSRAGLTTAGTRYAFGNLGLALTPAAGSTTLPGSTTVRRTTGTALTGQGTSVSIKRYYDIVPTTNAGLNVTLEFGYFETELNGLSEAQLGLFRSATGTSGPWQNVPASARNAAANTVTATGVDHFSIWTLGSSANPLPVELTAFTATAENPHTVRLAWTTASEKNSASFEVQRSTDGHTFRGIGTVAAAGTSSTRHTYEMLDHQLPAGAPVLYYRLRQVDIDGTATLSPVRAVSVSPAMLSVYPNPVTATATLTGALPGAAVQVLDVRGRLVLTTVADAAGKALLVLPTALPAGVYVVRAGQHTTRLVRQ